MESYSKKEIFGIIFFAASILILFYMFLTPLNHVIMHIDEYFSMTLATLPIKDIITVNTWDVHPPLYYILAKVAFKIGGIAGIDAIFSLRILSIIPYILLLIISATKIRKEFGIFSAGLFALSLAVMSEFFSHFLIARMYGWAILFIVIAFLAFREIIETQDKKAWVVFTAFSVLCAYTHYFAAISAGCLYLMLLAYILKFKKEELKTWGVSVVVAILLYVPWISSLINQLTQVHQSYWIPEVNLNTVLNALGYYAYANDAFFSVIAIIILITILAIFSQSKNIDAENRFFILGGIGVYIGTILLGIILSVVFKPILMVRYLLPATAVLWLTLSIILSKIENRKMFLISFALIVVLLISGIATTVTTNGEMYQNGVSQKNIMDNITQDPNSMLIVPSQNMIMYFLDYANHTDMYCLNVSHVFGENMNRLHKLYDFKTYNGTDIDKLIANNTDKNIYIISWNDPVLNTTTIKLDKQVAIVFSKVNQTNQLNRV